MRLLLRIIAVIAALSVVATTVFVVQFGIHGVHALLATGAFGLMTLIGWVVTFLAGSIAAVQLFRFRSSGRVAAAVLFGTGALYYALGLCFFRQPDAAVRPIVLLCVFFSVLATIVLSPSAKRACIRPHS